MKTTNTHLFPAMTEKSLKNLTAEVKETIASAVKMVTAKTFTAAELWRIQSSRRMASRRRIFA